MVMVEWKIQLNFDSKSWIGEATCTCGGWDIFFEIQHFSSQFEIFLKKFEYNIKL